MAITRPAAESRRPVRARQGDHGRILTAAEMRAAEAEGIRAGLTTGLDLMETAGQGVVAAMLDRWPDASPRRAAVLCGPGNNGGDGFVIARLLAGLGWTVRVWLFGDETKLPPDAAANCARWRELGPLTPLTLPISPEAHEEVLAWAAGGGDACHVVDALFGTGLTRPLDESGDDLPRLFADLSELGSHRDAAIRTVAVEVPSGLCADSGRVLRAAPAGDDRSPPAIRADLTVTFHTAKPGHLLADGPEFCGELRVVDIGLPRPLLQERTIEEVTQPSSAWVAKRSGHKYGYGHALVLAGGPGKGGAARMTARGALRIGAGLVTLAVPPAALQENAARLDAIMLRSLRDAEALTRLLEDERYNALAAGPGLGTGEREAALLSALLDASAQAGRGLVLDADALTLLAKGLDLRAKLHDRCILTPHDGEFARLFPTIAERLRARPTRGPAYSRLDAARDAAAQAGCILLLKGPDTVIADPSGRAAIHDAAYDRAAPWLATAGSGDVLSGFILGLLARRLPMFDAACSAAWLHAEAARSFGPGLVAEDLPDELPNVFRALGL